MALTLGVLIGQARLPMGSGPSPSVQASPVDGAGWTEPRAYSFVLETGCGEQSLVGRFRVFVRDRVTVAYEPLDPAAERNPGSAADIPTLGTMLAHVLEAQAMGGGVPAASPGRTPEGGFSAPVVFLETDPVDGHPVEVRIDWIPEAIDDEECHEISEYLPGAEAPAATTGPSATPSAPGGWQEPDAYSFVLQADCGLRVLAGTFRVFVADGRTARYEPLDEAAEGFIGSIEDIPTLGTILDHVEEAESSPDSEVVMETDPTQGYPVRVEIDWITSAIDDEECYTISQYAVDPAAS